MARVLQAIQQSSGGIAEHVLRLSAGLVERGHEVEVAGPAESPIYDDLSRAGVRIHRLPLVGNIWAPRHDWPSVAALYRILRRGRFAITHAHGAKAGALVRLAGLAASVPVVYSPHQFAFVANEYRPLRFPRLRWGLAVGVEWTLGRVTARLVCVSRFELRQAEREHIARPSRRRLVYHGVEVDRGVAVDPALARWRRDGPLFGAVSALRFEKGLHHLIDAVALLRDRQQPGVPPVKLAIVGDGPERDALAARIEARGVDDRIRLFPYSGRVEPHLLVLDAFVLPSHQFEVLSIGTIEAMACQLPVIATCVGGVPEVVADGISGRLVRPGDPIAIADAIVELAGDPDLRARMGEAGRQIAERRFRLDRMIDEIERLYAEAVGNAPV
jgi:glycosyltransferase involved in cell wall biosynthesis